MDFRLVPIATPDVVRLDWLQTPGGSIDETAELTTAVTIALCTDALADEKDILPDPNSTDRRGWWADREADTIWGGWPIGSRLWLLTRAKILDAGAREGATVARVDQYIRTALQPFVDHRLCSRFSVNVSLKGLAVQQTRRIRADVVIYRGPKSAIQLQYQALWDELSATIR
jgi:phage gp46-like protein